MEPALRFGQLSYDVAHLLAGGVLLCSFLLLYQRRTAAVINAFATQGAMLGAAAAWQGWVQGEVGLTLTAAIALVAKAALIPAGLHALVRRLDLHRQVEPALGIVPSMVAGVALVAVAVLAVLPATGHAAGALAREDLAIALSVLLLGVLMMLTRRNAVSQAVGLLSLENGLILAAVGVPGMPLTVELSLAALVLALAMVAAFFAHRMRHSLGGLDTAALDLHRGERG